MRDRYEARTQTFGWPLLFAATCACASTSRPTATTPPQQAPTPALVEVPKPELAVREDLPPEAYEVLRSRMTRHGDQMSAMMLAVVLLDYEVVRLLTKRLLEEPTLGRPAEGDVHSLNAMLPTSFFVHQDALRTAALELARAAEQTDDRKLIEAFNGVSRTCVACHSAYLHEALVPEDDLSVPCEMDGSCEEESPTEEPTRWREHDL